MQCWTVLFPFKKFVTGKSVSEALILESVNPQYDERLFIEFQKKYKLTTCWVQKLFFCFFMTFKTIFVHNLFLSWNSMNNLLSYCGLTDARMRASEKDLPVLRREHVNKMGNLLNPYLLTVLLSIYFNKLPCHQQYPSFNRH